MIVLDAIDLLLHQTGEWLPQLQRHAVLSGVALAISLAIGVPVGAALTRIERWAFAIISIANLGRTIPSLALMALVYPFVGTGFLPSLIALVAMGVPPILLTTYTGVREVDEGVREAARGMGLTSRQRLVQAELPVAAPVIISGVRTAAVQVVASATLASLIGGGGLGEMIMSGLGTMRYDLLLAGAFLVALLAVCCELAFSWLERHALPGGIREAASPRGEGGTEYSAGTAVSTGHWRLVAVACCIGAAAMGLAGGVANSMVSRIGQARSVGASGPLPTITVGSKDFTEQLVLGELYAQALEAQGYPVERRLNLGATAVADAALRSGAIDLYPEYTGTSLFAVLKGTMPAGGAVGADGARAAAGEAVYDAVQRGYARRNMKLLRQSPFSNGNAIVVTKATARAHRLRTLSDLAKVAPRLKLGAVPGFDTREDGLPLLRSRYRIRFGDVKTYENGIKYKALVGGKIDAVSGFETDGQIAANKLVVLEDDRGAWPPYHVAPVVSSRVARHSGPAFAATIDSVTALLDTRTMQQLNSRVEQGRQEPADVAAAFLKRNGLHARGARPKLVMGSKDFTEQVILGEIYAQVLEARGFPVERRLNLGATAVADGAIRSGRIDVYPEYTGTSLTAVLGRPVSRSMTAEDVHAQVRAGYRKRGLDVLAPSVFSNGNAIVVTRATAKRLRLQTLADLAKVDDRVRFAAVSGFATRADQMPLLRKFYGIRFASMKTYENGLKYRALLDGKVEALFGFETDWQVERYKLVVLRDDRRIWPPYHAAPIVSKRLMAQVGPDFAASLDHVSRLLDARTMQLLNARVDEGKREPEDVARAFLRSHGLVHAPA